MTSRPQLPAAFAPFAHVLQANRGGAVPKAVTQLAGRSSTPDTVEVTDSAGAYRAFLQPMGAKVGDGHGATLNQIDLGSDRAMIWTVSLATNKIVGGPYETTYTSKSFAVGSRAPGSFSRTEEALQHLAERDPAAAHLRKVIDEQFGGQWPPSPPDAPPPPIT
jgi:hypothetical protein